MIRNFIFIMFYCGLSTAFAGDNLKLNDIYRYKSYIGILGGYGSTTWEGLVPLPEKQNMAMTISTPTSVNEGGGVWGLLAGYEVTPYFGLEVNYVHYPNATIYFDPESIFTFEHDGDTLFKTQTQVLSFSGRLMLEIPHTLMRGYSSVGLAMLQRKDIITNSWRATPTFGLGVNFNVTERIMAEIGGNYTAGYGESELNPAQDYIPFLYSTFLKLAYRF